MKKLLTICMLIFLGMGAQAQVQGAKLQASGLTCSMCSKAVLSALQKVSFVQAVDVDIDKQEYGLTFKNGLLVDFDALSRAVEDAGFSVAKLSVTAIVPAQKVEKDQHIRIGEQAFHFLNAKGQQLPASATFTLVDKSFVSSKDFKKYGNLSKMSCVKTGKMESCCTAAAPASNSRVYHALL